MYKNFFKRFFDFLIALIALICISPILLIISILLFIANGEGSPSLEGGVWGRLLFLQERPGKDGKIFRIIKFKTMMDERDAEGNLLPDKDRITNVGKFVRKTSIDELPQLINVLKGDMALIGPRPLLPEYLPYYSEKEQLRHTVRPGITGWAQCHGRNNLCWDDKLALDAYYVENLSMLMDIKVLYLTIKNVIRGKDVNVIPSLNGGKLSDERKNKIGYNGN